MLCCLLVFEVCEFGFDGRVCVFGGFVLLGNGFVLLGNGFVLERDLVLLGCG